MRPSLAMAYFFLNANRSACAHIDVSYSQETFCCHLISLYVYHLLLHFSPLSVCYFLLLTFHVNINNAAPDCTFLLLVYVRPNIPTLQAYATVWLEALIDGLRAPREFNEALRRWAGEYYSAGQNRVLGELLDRTVFSLSNFLANPSAILSFHPPT